MKKLPIALLASVLSLATLSLFVSSSALADEMKEWTVIVFLNGHNNLDSFGKQNIDSMATVGSTDKVNVVVQWASQQNGNTKRIYVNKGGFDLIEDMAPVDMGDYNKLVEFATWAAKHYPAKKYLVDVWDHGNGWHLQSLNAPLVHTNDISFDDTTGHSIKTEELGIALSQIAKATGGKVELYASDACLMAMAEVANEVADSVKFFGGSQETEPGAGWPYGPFLADLTAKPEMDGGEAAKALSRDYKAAYQGGMYGTQDVTFSAWDLSHLGAFNESIKGLAHELLTLDQASMQKAATAMASSQGFALADYKDLGDFLDNMGKARMDMKAIDDVRTAISSLVLENDVTAQYSRAHGLSVWMPGSSEWSSYSERYKNLQFNKATAWADFLAVAVPASGK